jgi:hypothetical protein
MGTRKFDGSLWRFSARNACKPSSATCVPTLVEGIDHDKNRTDDRQVLEWFQDEGFEQGTIVMNATLKIGVVLYDLSESDFKRRIAVGEMASNCRKEKVGLPFGLFPP